MSKWIRTDIDLGIPCIRLTLDARDATSNGADLLRTIEREPEKIESIVMLLICTSRPELMGGRLIEIRMDYARLRWEFMYMHPSLAPVAIGEEIATMPLLPQREEQG